MALLTIANGTYTNNVPLYYFNPVWGVDSLGMIVPAEGGGGGGREGVRVGGVRTFPLPAGLFPTLPWASPISFFY